MGASLSWDIDYTYYDTKRTFSIKLYVTSTSGSHNNDAQSGYITVDGEKKPFKHAFASNTKTHLATLGFTCERTTADRTITIKAAYATGVSVGTISKSTTATIAALPKYTVTFNGNGGTTTTKSVFHGKTTTFPSSAGSKAGYTFNNWNTWQGGGGTSYAKGAATPSITAARTFYAQWTANTYYVKYNGNGSTSGSTAQSQHTYGTPKALTSNGFSRNGYSFGGWATSASGSVVYSNGQSVSNLTTTSGGTVNLYAVWNPNSYSVKFNKNDGSSSSVTQSGFVYDTAKALQSNSFTREGYAFKGWSTSSSGAVVYSNGAAVKNLATSGTVNLYAVWQQTFVAPSYLSVTSARYSSDVTITPHEDSPNVKFNVSFKNGSNANGTVYVTLLVIKYKEVDSSSSFQTLATKYSADFTNDGDVYSVEHISTGDLFNTNSAYDIQFLLIDENYPNGVSRTDRVTKSSFIWKVPPSADSFSFGVPVEVNGNIGSNAVNANQVNSNTVNSNQVNVDDLSLSGKMSLLNLIYPVGSIYMSVNNVSPQSFLGGTWTALQDRFLLGASSTYGVNDTGGRKNLLLPSHTHHVAAQNITIKYDADCSGTGAKDLYYSAGSGSKTLTVPAHDTGAPQGSNATLVSDATTIANANMPPYLAVYMWKRTA